MKIPRSAPIRTHTVFIDRFGGLKAAYRATDGDLVQCRNLTCDRYPALSTRHYRSRYIDMENPQGLSGCDKPIWVDDDVLYYNGSSYVLEEHGERLIASDGRYTLVFPDNVCLENETAELYPMCLLWEGNTITFSDGFLAGQPAQANAVTLTGDVPAFRVGDAVEIDGCTMYPENNGTHIIRGISPTGDVLYFDENCFTLREGSTYSEFGGMSVTRKVPQADRLFVSGSRFWCTDKNQVYACKPGDPFNWYVYDGLSSDSYALEISAGGWFTGACDYEGTPVFFKENAIYRILGTRPANFELISVRGLGIRSGCGKSLCEIGGALYYLSAEGITVWSGGSPRLLTGGPDTRGATEGVAGTDGRRYWISLVDAARERHLYVYDTVTDTWIRQDDMKVYGFAECECGLYFLDSGKTLWRTETQYEGIPGQEGVFSSEAVFAPIRCGTHDAKIMQSLSLRLVLEEDTSTLTATVSYDGLPEEPAGYVCGEGEHILHCSIVPRRADSFRLILRGSGKWSLYSMQYSYSDGHTGPYDE